MTRRTARAATPLRTTIPLLQRQLQETQAHLMEARSSYNRSPSVPTPTSTSTPVVMQQLGTSFYGGQGTDFQAVMASALWQMSGTTLVGPRHGESAMAPFLIMGATLFPKMKVTIWAHQFIELGSLSTICEATVYYICQGWTRTNVASIKSFID